MTHPPRLGAPSWTPELGYHKYDHRQYSLPIDAQQKPPKMLTWSAQKKYSNMGGWGEGTDELWVMRDMVGNGVIILEEDGSWRYARVMQYYKRQHKLVYTDPSKTRWCDLKNETFMVIYPCEMAKLE